MASINPPKPHQPKGGLSGTTIVVVIIAGILLIVGGLLIGAATPSILPVQASAESVQTDNLFHILLVIGGAVFLLVQGMLVYSIWRFRAKPGETGDGMNLHGNTTLEITWTAVPAVVVFVLTILSWQVFNTMIAPKQGEMSIVANAARFNWNFQYNEPLSIMGKPVDVSKLPQTAQDDLKDDNMITLTSATLYVIAGQPVVMEMQPKDVIHAFWIPAFRIKQDLLPGRVTTVRYTPTVAGEYLIECTQLCGAGHGGMRAKVEVFANQADFDAALQPIMSKIIYPPVDPVQRGHDLLASDVYPCYTCHTLSDLSSANWVGKVGPALDGVADRAATTRSAATGQTPEQYIYTAVHEPQAYLVPGYGPLMPQLNVPECQVWDIVSYLATQSTTGQAPFKVDIPPQCVVTADSSGAEATAEATSESTAEATAETTAEATSEATAEATTEGGAAIQQFGNAGPNGTPTLVEATAEITAVPTAVQATIPPASTSAGSSS